MYVFISLLRGTNGLPLRLQFLILNLFILFLLILPIPTYFVHNIRTAPICFPPLGTSAFAVLFHSLFAFFLIPHFLFIPSHLSLLNPSFLFLHFSRFSSPPLFCSSSSLLIHPLPRFRLLPPKISFTLVSFLSPLTPPPFSYTTIKHASISLLPTHILYTTFVSFLSLCHTFCLFNSLLQMCFHPSIFLKGKP